MRIIKTVFAFILLINTNLFAQEIRSLWVDKAVNIDGSPDEWPPVFRYYDGNTKLQFSISNDTGNIYVCIKVTDEQGQLRLFRSGLNVWIDPKGKKKEDIGIVFPMKQERRADDAEERQQRQGFLKRDMKRLKELALTTQTTIKIRGFMGIDDQVLPLENKHGINVAFNWDSLDIFCVEYKFPMAATLQHGFSAADTLKTFGLGFVVNALDMPQRKNNADNSDQNSDWNNSGNMRGSNNLNNGMGSPNNPQMGSMNQSSGGSDYSTTAQEQKVWSKLRLVLGR